MVLAWHLAFLRDLLVHKALVLIEGRRLRVPLLQLVAHDLSKLSPAEYASSVRFACAPRPLTDAEIARCDRALDLHRSRNPHHPEFWLAPYASAAAQPMPMPDRYRREMLADWRAVGRAKEASTADWYLARFDRRKLHPETRRWVEEQLGI